MILIISALFPPEQVVSANLSYDLASSFFNDEVVVVSPKPTRPYGVKFKVEDNLRLPFEHVVLDSYTCPKSKVLGRFRESDSFGRHVKRYIKENHSKIEVIYANTWPLLAQKHLAKVAAKYSIPLVLHVQDIYPESLSKKSRLFGFLIDKLFIPMDRRTLRLANKIVTISEQMKKYVVATRDVKEQDVLVVRNWQNDSGFTKFNNLDVVNENKKFCFLYLGSIAPTAGVDLLIRAFGKADLKDACLIIAGNGSDKDKCVNVAKEISKDIRFMDVSPEQVASVQAQADILLLPLKKGIAATALPSKMTAYMFSAKPIIASVDEPSEIADIITENDCGWVVSPEREQELASCMEDSVDAGKEHLRKLGANSLIYASKNLSKEANLNRLTCIIQEQKRSC